MHAKISNYCFRSRIAAPPRKTGAAVARNAVVRLPTAMRVRQEDVSVSILPNVTQARGNCTLMPFLLRCERPSAPPFAVCRSERANRKTKTLENRIEPHTQRFTNLLHFTMDKSSQSQPLSQSSTTGGLIDGVAAVGHNVAAKLSEVASSVYATAAQATAPTMGRRSTPTSPPPATTSQLCARTWPTPSRRRRRPWGVRSPPPSRPRRRSRRGA